MKKILAFGASNSKNSINKKFATFVAQRIADADLNLIDLNDFEMPLFGVDKEKEIGSPEKAQQFLKLIETHDAIVMSLAEHNGNYTTAFKNILDWVSRIKEGNWQNKPMFLLSTSPGGRGGSNVMSIALKALPFMKANIIAHFSLPSFKQNFSEEQGIIEPELAKAFEEQFNKFTSHLKLEASIQE